MLEQTFVIVGMIPFPLFLLHTIVKTACPYGWMPMLHQSIFHLDLFSFNPRLAVHFFSPISRFDSMILSLIFGWLRVLSVLSARWDWSDRAHDEPERDLLMHTFCLSELGPLPIDNFSKRHSSPRSSPL